MTSAFATDRIRTIDLDHEQLLVLDDPAGTRLQVLAGGLWLTEERSLEDRFAGAGQWLRLESRGRAVAGALGPSRVRLFEPARRASRVWRAALQRSRPRADGFALRSVAALLSLLLGLGLPEMLARGLQASADGSTAGSVAQSEPAGGATVGWSVTLS